MNTHVVLNRAGFLYNKPLLFAMTRRVAKNGGGSGGGVKRKKRNGMDAPLVDDDRLLRADCEQTSIAFTTTFKTSAAGTQC